MLQQIDDGCVHLGVGRGLTRTAMLAMLAFDVEHGRHVSRCALVPFGLRSLAALILFMIVETACPCRLARKSS